MAQVKLLSMTLGLTVLIWASADSLVNETGSIGVSFELVPDAAATTLLIQPLDQTTSFDVQVSGPRRIIEDIKEEAPLRARLRIPDQPTGTAQVPLDRRSLKQQLAEQWNQFEKLTIVSIRPDVLSVIVDHWVTREVSLGLGRLALTYAVEPQLHQTSTSVRMRESRLSDLPDTDNLQMDISADVERVLKDQPVGERMTVPVTLDPGMFGPGATLEPPTISVTAAVRARRTTAQIPTVPILVAVSFPNLERPLRPVTRDGTPLSLVTQAITVTGPTEEVSRLVRGAARLFGIIQLKQDDLDRLGTLRLRTPEYHLPPGVELAEEPEPIEFKLIDATATNGSD